MKMIQATNTVSIRARQSGAGLHLFAGYLKAFLMGLVLLLSLGSNISLYASELKEDDLLLLDFSLERQRLASSVTAYSYRNTAVVSLAEAGAALEFPIIVNSQAGTATGWFIRPERTFKLDINEGYVEVEGKRMPLKPGDALVHNEAIFITMETFSSWFPVSLSLKLSTLTVGVEPRETLPLQERQSRRTGAPQIFSVGPAKLPLIESPYKLLGPHAADIGLGYSIRRPVSGGKAVTGLSHSILASGDIAFMNSSLYLSGNNNALLSQARMNVSRDRLGYPLGLRYVEIGDIVPASVPGLSYGGVERGILLQGGGSAIGRDDMINGDVINLSGDALPDWDVELFINGNRVAFQTVGSDGRYNFINIDPLSDRNDLELVFYGPSGERRTETITRYFGLGPDQPGSLRYQFSASHKGEKLYEGEDISNQSMTDRGTLRLAGSFAARILPKLSLRGSWNNLTVSGEQLNYSSLGFNTEWRGFSLGIEAINDPYKDLQWSGSLLLPAKANIFGFDTRFTHSQYAQSVLVDDPLALGQYDLILTSRTGLNMSGPIGRSNAVFSFYHNREDDRTSNSFSAGFSGRLDRLNYGNNINYYLFSRDSSGVRSPSQVRGQLFFNTSFRPLLLRGGLNYTLRPDAEAQQYYIDGNMDIAEDMSVQFGLTHDPLRKLTRYTSGLNWKLPQVTLSPRINYDSDGQYSGYIYASFSLAPKPDRPGVLISGRSLATSGTIAARVFLDNDNSDSLSLGDEPLPNVMVRAPQAFRTAKTDERGVAYLTDLMSTRATDVMLVADSLPNAQMLSKYAGNSVHPRPTVATVIDFPVSPTGEISGHVYKIQKGSRLPFAGAMIELRNLKNKVVSFKISGQDGFFSFDDVPYDSYSLELAGKISGGANRQTFVLERDHSEYTNIEIIIAETDEQAAIIPVKQQVNITLPPAPALEPAPLIVAPVSNKPELKLVLPMAPAIQKPSDGRLVQLGAFADLAGAKAYRQKLLLLPPLVGGQVDIVSVDLGKHGQFHRVVATPITSTADTLCNSLKSDGVECFTIAP